MRAEAVNSSYKKGSAIDQCRCVSKCALNEIEYLNLTKKIIINFAQSCFSVIAGHSGIKSNSALHQQEQNAVGLVY